MHFQGKNNGQQPKKRNCFRVLDMNAATNTSTTTNAENEGSDDDINHHIAELKRAWNKPEDRKSMSHIKMLLKQTRQKRIQMLESDPSRRIKPIFDEFHCFGDSQYVSMPTYK